MTVSRPAIALYLIASFVAANAQDLHQKVEYTTGAITLERAFVDLTKQTRVKLFAAQEIEHEIIILRLKGVPLDAVMSKIASTVGGEWSKQHNEFTLGRSPEITARLRDQALTDQARSYRDGLNAEMKRLQVDKPLDQSQIRILATKHALSQESPATGLRAYLLPDERAAVRLLSLIDPKQIVSIQEGTRRTFSNKPTAAELEIPGDCADIATSLVDEYNAFAKAYKAAQKPGTRYSPLSPESMSSVPTRFVLTLENRFGGPLLSLDMFSYDANNHATNWAQRYVNLAAEVMNFTAERAKLTKELAAEPDLPMSSLTKAFLEYTRLSMSAQAPVSDEVRAALSHPTEIDPLAICVSDALLGTAANRSENLVAYPDDSMFEIAQMAGMDGHLKPSLVIQAIDSMKMMLPEVIEEDNGWMTVHPADRLHSTETRTDRAALEKYIQTYRQDGYLSIDNRATFARTMNGQTFPMLAYRIPWLLDPSIGMRMTENVPILKLYDSLDTSQRQRLASGQSIHLSSLSPEQVALLSTFVFAEHPRPSGFGNDLTPNTIEYWAATQMPEALPKGLTSDMTLSMSEDRADMFFVNVSTVNGRQDSRMDLQGIAQFLSGNQHNLAMPDPSAKIASIEPGQYRFVTLTLKVDDQRSIAEGLQEEWKMPGGPWTVDSLPPDLKNQLDIMLEYFKDEAAKRNPLPSPAPPPSAPRG